MKSFCFFEQRLSNFRYKKQLLTIFKIIIEKRFEKLREIFGKYRATCGKP